MNRDKYTNFWNITPQKSRTTNKVVKISKLNCTKDEPHKVTLKVDFSKKAGDE